MKKKIIRQYIGVAIASMVFATYAVSLTGAQTTTPTKERTQTGTTGSIPITKLENQGLHLEQLYSELQRLYDSLQPEIQKREQSSLSLREFSNNLFSCRGFA